MKDYVLRKDLQLIFFFEISVFQRLILFVCKEKKIS
jgi:hypothetical protein